MCCSQYQCKCGAIDRAREIVSKSGAECSQKYIASWVFQKTRSPSLASFACAHAGGDKETTIVTHSPPSSPHLVVTLPPPPPHAFEQQSHFSTPNREYAARYIQYNTQWAFLQFHGVCRFAPRIYVRFV